MVGACSAHGWVGSECRTRVVKFKGRDQLEGLDVNGRTPLKLILTECKGVDRIHLASHMVQLRALMNTVIKLRVPQKSGIS
jgi:hypothetical protein